MRFTTPVRSPQHLRRSLKGVAATMALFTLAACGGGGGAGDSAGSTGETAVASDEFSPRDAYDHLPEPNAGIDFEAEARRGAVAVDGDSADSVVALKALPVAANAAVTGAWGPQVKWPMMPIHAAVLPDGRVMTYGSLANGQQGGIFNYDVWDPSVGTGDESHLTLPNTTQVDLFCSAQVVLPLSGDLFMAGGDVFSQARGRSTNQPNNDTTIFRLGSNTIDKGEKMKRPRWYATATTLPNGDVYVQGGKGGEDLPEIRKADGSTVLLDGVPTKDIYHEYPRNWVAPDGKIFGFSATKMYRVDVDANGGRGSRRDVGTLNYKSHWEGSAVMFQPGKILMTEASGNRAAVIDINSDTPTVTDVGTMSNTRMWHNSTVLADGTVAISGGAEFFDFKRATARNPIYQIDLWNPKTNTWTHGAAQQRMRLYHSAAVLLPDGTLFSGGGGAGGPETNLNAEIYYPPYLYNADGTEATRPVIDQAPMVVQPMGSLVLESGDAASIRRVTMVATGSATHSFDMNQRFIELEFRRDGNRLVAQLPKNEHDTPPGYYMVFILNEAGTPSHAKMVRVNVRQAEGTNPDIVQVYRYSAQDGLRYRYSTDPALGGEWTRQGEAFLAFGSARPDTVPVYRYSATENGKTRYRYSTETALRERGWQRDQIVFHAYSQAGEGRVQVDEYRQYRAGMYLQYSTTGAVGGGFAGAAPIFHVPAGRASTTPVVNDTTAPSVPQNLRAEVAVDGTVTVTWDKSTDAGGSGLLGYRLRRGPIVLTPNLLTTERHIDKVTQPGQYTYSVEAVDTAGNVSGRTLFRAQMTQSEDAALEAANLVRVYRYRAPGGDGDLRYMFSADASLGNEWTRQELAFYAYAKPQANTVPVYRYMARANDGTPRYLISINPALGRGWTREHVVFHVLRNAQTGTKPVHEYYRVYNGWYLGYTTGDSFGVSPRWRRHAQVFHVPTWNGQ
ncbi:MAG: DUF1929 domain-containing protein [Lautropia sp.]|nr:DUF1929 domain-containing protein [Lautropia sp.]